MITKQYIEPIIHTHKPIQLVSLVVMVRYQSKSVLHTGSPGESW